MSFRKTEKELAFIRDLYIAPDWGERFAGLMDENITLPTKGRVLYVGSGTGAHALALSEKAGKRVAFVCTDESEECLEIARAKSSAITLQPEFYRNQFESLQFEDDTFDLVLGEISLVSVERLPEILDEMVRVAAPGATVAISVSTAASFGEFFSVYWEALLNAQIEDHLRDVESLVTELPTASEIEELAGNSGLEEVASWTKNEEFKYASAREFLESPLIADFLMEKWMETLADPDTRERARVEIMRIIDEDRSDMDFALSLKATLVTGKKPG